MALAMHHVIVEANMHRFTLLAAVAAVAAARLAAGCFGTVGYSAGVSSGGGGPDLVYAAPGVQVIADYNEPIFFSDSLYWRFDGVRWYRSSHYIGGWVYATPPPAVGRIERPHDFVHYRPQGWVARRAPQQGPIARDHRGEAPRIERRPPTYGPPPSHAAPPPRAAPPPHAAPPQHDRPPVSNDRDHRAPPKDDDRHDRHQEPR
jgi:hypothetical protein